MVKRRGNNSTINHGNSRASESPGCELEGETMSQPAGVCWGHSSISSPSVQGSGYRYGGHSLVNHEEQAKYIGRDQHRVQEDLVCG